MRHARRRLRRSDRRYGRDQRGYAHGIRVAVVTGGSSGIGAAVARRLTERGWRCVLLARNRERLERAAAEVGAEAEQCDVGDRVQVEQAAERIAARHSSIHLLVNSAGIGAGGGFLDVPAERIEDVTRINYLGSVWALRAFLPLLERGAPSDVVNVASVAGTTVVATSGPYSASKHAQLAFSRSVTAELAPRRIRVHSVNPGPVETPGFPQRYLLARRWARPFLSTPEDVADAAVTAVERGRTEVFIPGILRVGAIAAGVIPGTVSRVHPFRRAAE